MRLWVLLLLIPLVQAEPGIWNPESGEVTLYAHIGESRALTTGAPPEDFTAAPALAVGSQSNQCVPAPTGFASGDAHQWVYTPIPYDQHYAPPGGPHVDTFWSHGLAYDLEIMQDIGFTWYFEGKAPVSPTPADTYHPPMQVVVDVHIYTGQHAVRTPNLAPSDGGDLVARGTSNPILMAGAATTPPAGWTSGLHNGVWVYGLHMDLPVVLPVVPWHEAFTLQVRAYVENPYCGSDEYVMPDVLRQHTSKTARPHLTMTIAEPVRIHYLHPQFVRDDVVIHASASSPFGNYDLVGSHLEAPGWNLTVAGPSAPGFEPFIIPPVHDETSGRPEAQDAVWGWEYRDDEGRNGGYHVSLEVQSDQGALARANAWFEVGSGKLIGCGDGADTTCFRDQQADGMGSNEVTPWPAALAIAGLAMALRRRR